MSVLQHVYDIPSEEELARLVGSATPHFALQIRARVAAYAATLPPDHRRQSELERHLVRLDALATHGESAGKRELDLRAKPPLRPAGRA
jgi:hypothetical protein